MRGVSHLKLVGLSAFVASLIAVPSAHAALAGGAPFVSVDRPDLTTVTVVNDQPTGTPQEVRYCFDKQIRNTPINNNGFYLNGYDEDVQVNSNNANLDLNNTNCVIARFPAGTDLKKFTIGGVVDGAVRDVTGTKLNRADTTAVSNCNQGSGAGDTSFGDIVAVTTNASFNELLFTIDRRVQNINNQGAFFYYDAAGNRVDSNAASISNYDNNGRTVLRVHFPTAGGNQSVRDATRAGAQNGAYADQNGVNNRLETASVNQEVGGLQDGLTARPDLVKAQVVSGPGSGTAVDFYFDAKVKVIAANRFRIVEQDRDQNLGQNATVLQQTGNGQVVRVYFALSTDAISENDVYAYVNEDAVESTGNPSSLPNTFGSAAIGSINKPACGFTAGPDAQSVTFDNDAGTALIDFDDDVDNTPNPADFTLLDKNGNNIGAASAVVQVDNDTVLLLFGGSNPVDTARGVSINYGAVNNERGEDNVQQIIGRGAAAASNGGGGGGNTGGNTSGGTTGTSGASNNAQAVSPVTIAVSPAKSTKASKKAGRLTYARLVRTKSGKYVLLVKVTSKARTAKVRLRTVSKKGKVVRSVVKTVKTNKTVRITGLKLKKGQRLRASLA